MRKLLLVSILLAISNMALSLETAQYRSWTKRIKDSADRVNTYINDNIARIVRKNSYSNCSKIKYAIYRFFDTRPNRLVNQASYDLWHDRQVDKHPRNVPFRMLGNRSTNDDTIYRRIYIKHGPMAPTVNINGIYLGLDKIDHLFSLAEAYESNYSDARSSGYSHERSIQKAIDIAILGENGMLGLGISKVFSYGDLEANYQGFLMNQNLCHGSNPYIKRGSDGRYHFDKNFNIRKYVNPYWDETFNNSYFQEGWPFRRIKKELLSHCRDRSTRIVRERVSYYKTFNKSYSQKYLEKLMGQGRLNRPYYHSLDNLCGDGLIMTPTNPRFSVR